MRRNRMIFVVATSLLVGACAGTASPSPSGTPAASPSSVSSPAASSGPVTLNVINDWAASDPKGPIIAQVFADFQAANPDIKIQVSTFKDADVPTKVETAFLAGQEPDIIMNNYWAPNLGWESQGVTVPVNDMLTQWGLVNAFDAAALTSFTQSDGKVVAFPLEGFNWPIWYNKAIFDKAGVAIPTTTDELIAAVPKIKAAGFQVLAAPGAAGPGRALFKLIVQSRLTDDEMRQVYAQGGFSTNANAKAGVDLFVALRDAGVFADGAAGLTPDATAQMYLDGKAAMQFEGSWGYASPSADLLASTQLGGFPLPSGSPHAKPIYYQDYSGKGVWITRNGSKKLDAVQKLVQFLYKPAVIGKFVEQTGMVPPTTNAQVDASKLNPLFSASLKLGETAEAAPFWNKVTPGSADTAWLNVSKLAYVPGTSAAEIASQLDAAFKQ